MGLYNEASLIMYPSGVKASKIYCQKPIPTYGADIVVNGDFATDSNWNKGTGWTISGGQLVATGALNNSQAFQNRSFGIGTYYIQLNANVTSGTYRVKIGGTFVSDTVSTSGIVTFKITITSAQTYFGIEAKSTLTATFDNVVVREVLTDDADLDFSRASTATRVNESGLIEEVASGVPRIDFTGGGCGKLLLEPQRTNLLLRSQEINNGSWTKDRINVTTDATTSPDGTTNAEKLIATSATGIHFIRQAISFSVTTYTLTVFAKKAEYKYLLVRGIGGLIDGYFNLDTGVVDSITNGTASMQDYGDGWYRCTVVYNYSSGSVLDIAITNTLGGLTYTGDDVSGIYLWGVDLQEGTYPTSYIPTAGSTVTRVVEISTNNLLTNLQSKGILGTTSGTFVWHCNLNGIAEFRTIFSLDGLVGFISLADGRTAIRYNGFGTYGALSNRGMGEFKIGLVWSGTSLKSFINGSLVDNVTMSGTISPTTLSIFNPSFGIGISQRVQSIYAASTNLADADLEYLTGTSYDSYELMAADLGYTVL